ncbi:hypothetical protein SAMN03080617_00146 [Algoriphagus alkaliphilus]|uniref:Uncharacterized protein n=1 Tax=Algoriphagus alkaliphilus TaxID=279824 RepID=A0A1G5UYH6_9BACT|nr:hypothetical protein SAMN03080617_00146 [Algoriphagus alkaliphilus]
MKLRTFPKVRYRKNASPVILLFFTLENTELRKEEANGKLGLPEENELMD